MRTAYRCRAYPDEAQQQVLARTFGCVRVIWNLTLAARRVRYATDRKSTSYAETDRLIVIDRWYPSSKTCSACGHLLAKLSLNTRYWTCPSCRARHDRDINAAKNILAAGLAVSACGAGVRLQGVPLQRPAVKQEPQPARAGIPVLQRGE